MPHAELADAGGKMDGGASSGQPTTKERLREVLQAGISSENRSHLCTCVLSPLYKGHED